METLDTYLLCHIAQFLDLDSKKILCLVNKSFNIIINDLINFVNVPLRLERHKAFLARRLRKFLLEKAIMKKQYKLLGTPQEDVITSQTWIQLISNYMKDFIKENMAREFTEHRYGSVSSYYTFWGLPLWFFYCYQQGITEELCLKLYDNVMISYILDTWYTRELYTDNTNKIINIYKGDGIIIDGRSYFGNRNGGPL